MAKSKGGVLRRRYVCKAESRDSCPKCQPDPVTGKRAGHRVKTWSIAYYVPGQVDKHGRPIKTVEPTSTTDWDEAKKLRLERLYQLGIEKRPQTDVSGLRWRDLVVGIRAHYRAQGQSMRYLRDCLRPLDPFFQNHTALAITGTEINRYINHRLGLNDEGEPIKGLDSNGKPVVKPAANATINNELALLARMFTVKVESNELLPIHVPYIKLLKKNNTRRDQVIVVDRMRELLKEFRDPQLRSMVWFSYLTGWRCESDVQTREWDKHVFWEREIVLLRDGEGKEGKERKMPFFPDLRVLLEEQRRYTNEVEQKHGIKIPWVWHRLRQKDGKVYATPIKDYERAWRSACQRLAKKHPDWNCAGWLRHGMRYSAVENSLTADVDPLALCSMIGMVPATLDRYHSLSDARIKRQAVKLQRLFSEGEKVVEFPQKAAGGKKGE